MVGLWCPPSPLLDPRMIAVTDGILDQHRWWSVPACASSANRGSCGCCSKTTRRSIRCQSEVIGVQPGDARLLGYLSRGGSVIQPDALPVSAVMISFNG